MFSRRRPERQQVFSSNGWKGYTAVMFSLDLLGPVQWLVLILSAALVGLTKAGLNGISMITLPILVALFGAKVSSGLILGVLIAGDVTALWNYRKDLSPPHLAKTLPWALVGILIGVAVGGAIPEEAFKRTMAALVILSTGVLVYTEWRGGAKFPEAWWAAAPLGLLAGFASMVGNAAGSVMGLYLLSSGLGKGKLVGTSVWFFFIVNLVKLPFHLFIWHTASLQTFLADLAVAPVAVLATILGVKIVRIIPEKPYRVFLIIMSALGGIYLAL